MEKTAGLRERWCQIVNRGGAAESARPRSTAKPDEGWWAAWGPATPRPPREMISTPRLRRDFVARFAHVEIQHVVHDVIDGVPLGFNRRFY